MTKRQKDFAIRLAAYLIFLATTFLPYDKYSFKGIGYVILFTAIAKDEIKDILTKGNKKDITILVMAFLFFSAVMILPNNIILMQFLSIFLFIAAIYKENIKDSIQRFRKKDNKI
ncbi:hypothetical protein [Clostridium intestinale]|uniref:Uncharacterized protein n=1 Tax=Clostridium intestinale URNW TaxID=1294142 RepID=U2Q4Z3_9CLOT|nr:hypothetical protein [Clostridium intestinale]ERK31184.1 hypothetical protein CINTURNW_2628 [Clostridium intestinale URNW]